MSDKQDLILDIVKETRDDVKGIVKRVNSLEIISENHSVRIGNLENGKKSKASWLPLVGIVAAIPELIKTYWLLIAVLTLILGTFGITIKWTHPVSAHQ